MNYCIIGAGISGLNTAYRLLSQDLNSTVTLYEKNKIGGHSYVFNLNENEKIDLGFQVFNKNSYPNMIKLFNELDIKIQKTDMSFSVNNHTLTWSSNLKSLFLNIFNIKLWNIIYNMMYFNSLSKDFIRNYTDKKIKLSLKEFLNNNKFSKTFIEGFLIPFCSSVWSTDPKNTNSMPAWSLFNFMNNHGLLSFKKDQWFTLANRSEDYVKKIINKFNDRLIIIKNSPQKINKNEIDHILYDHVIFAIHGDQINNLLNEKEYNNIFKKITYNNSQCYLHQDLKYMPRKKIDWTSWNFLGDNKFICTYWCNRLQSDLKTKNLFFTLNPSNIPNNVLHKVNFSHPNYNLDLIKAQKEIENIQGKNNIWFVGAYLRNGFHEDAIVSSLKVVNMITQKNNMIYYPIKENDNFLKKILYNKFINTFERNITKGRLYIQIPNKGIIIINKDCKSNIKADLSIKSIKFIYLLFTRHDLGFAESYMNGYITTNNINNLLDLFVKSNANKKKMINFSYIFKFWDKINFFYKQDNNLKNTKRNIASHYDLGNELYSRFLDQTMTYSSAFFNGLEVNKANLSSAQNNKYDRIIEKLNIQQDDHVLEIGCGWGGFAIRANQTIGCKITCLTLSEEQKNYFEEKIGQNSNIEILLKDYRLENRKFDKIVSIEMIEAVGINYMDIYFKSIRNNLKKGGSAMIQAICIPEERFKSYSKNVEFISRYIFPGGALPSIPLIQKNIKNQNMQITDLKNITIDYANTLKIWHQNFDENWLDIKNNWSQGDEYFNKMWKYYFAYCEVGFRNNLIQTYQIKFE